MVKKENLYDKDSIQSLEPLEFVRLRPSVYAGSVEYSTQLLVELYANIVDEFQIGNATQAIIESSPDGSYFIEDNGQGFLINEVKEEGRTILENAFSVLNTSGKYTEDGVYGGSSIGINGIGCKLATFLSHTLEVISWRDGEFEHIWFVEGKFSRREVGKWDNKNNSHGTKVIWRPSEEFFTHTEIEENKIIDLIQSVVCLCPGFTTVFNGKEYFSKNGIEDLITISKKGNEIIKNRLKFHYEQGKHKIDLALTYTDNYSANIMPYVNTGYTTSGSHITQMKTILTREMNKFFRDKKWLKDKDSNLTGEDVQEGLCLAFHINTVGVGYDGQLKDRIVKLDFKPFTEVVTTELQNWLAANEKDVKKIADKCLAARRAREAAKKARDAVRQPKEKGLKAKMQISNKFIDCVNKNPKERNLLLVEGLSAGSAAIEARNPKTDSIYMLRGKTISPLKTEISKILANQEMSDIIRVIGAGFDKDFDVTKMNFDKIVITSDMDSDGADIELLLITFFYTYMRPLVEAGKLYRAVTPLYIVRKGKEELYFYTEEEMENWKAQKKSGWDILRAKGYEAVWPLSILPNTMGVCV